LLETAAATRGPAIQAISPRRTRRADFSPTMSGNRPWDSGLVTILAAAEKEEGHEPKDLWIDEIAVDFKPIGCAK
jgi:hypothetical protein